MKILSKTVKLLKYGHKVFFSDRYLLATNTVISVVLSLTGDTMQQKYQIIQGNMKTYNKVRSGHTAASGLVTGIFCHYWYIYLDKLLPGRSFMTIMKKLVLDQVICSPIYIGLYFGSIGLLERKNMKELVSESLHKGTTVYIMEWLVWPPAQVFNFYFLPTKYRVLYDNAIGLGFDTYFSNIKYHSDQNKKMTEKSNNSFKGTVNFWKTSSCQDFLHNVK